MRHARFGHSLLRIISNAMMGLAVLFAVVAVISLFRGDTFMLHTEVMTSPTGGPTSQQRVVTSWRGRLWFAYVRAELVEQSKRHENRWRFYHKVMPGGQASDRYNAPAAAAWVGLDWRAKGQSSIDPDQGLYVYRERFFTVPYWLIIVSCGGLGWCIGAKPRLIRRRRQRGLCVTCGYDLRSTPGRCPECGATAG